MAFFFIFLSSEDLTAKFHLACLFPRTEETRTLYKGKQNLRRKGKSFGRDGMQPRLQFFEVVRRFLQGFR